MRIRPDVRALSTGQKQAFVHAVLAMRKRPSRRTLPAASLYDDYVATHLDAMMTEPGWAHGGPAFLPWHRELLRRFEADLISIDPKVALPYWDWTALDSAAALWSADLMGGDGRASDGRVMDGPFAFDAGAWTLTLHEMTMAGMGVDPGFDAPDLKRRFGTIPGNTTLPTAEEVASAMTVCAYDRAPWNRHAQPSFRNILEGGYGPNLHNRVHVWVGGRASDGALGSMNFMTSLNDPVFWLHHCNVDRLFADWRRRNPIEPYLPTSGGPEGHNASDVMKPWGVTPQSLLDCEALGYRYDRQDPVGPSSLPDIAVAIGWKL